MNDNSFSHVKFKNKNNKLCDCKNRIVIKTFHVEYHQYTRVVTTALEFQKSKEHSCTFRLMYIDMSAQLCLVSSVYS